tara:strand:+ start:423 stop:1508 length:1086 start_codon:yes stop_codon:yes gene_type:complete
MKILFVGNSGNKFGGPSSVMNNLKKNLEMNYNDEVKILDIEEIKKKFFSKIICKDIDKDFINCNIINFHELWNPLVILLAKRAEKLGIPFFFTFHGVLNRWSLKQNSFIKKLFLNIFYKKIFQKSAGFQFLTEEEYHEASDIYPNFSLKSFILQNGIDIYETKNQKLFTEEEKLKLLFLGRKHPKKGLNSLIEAFKLIKKNKKKISLQIIGPKSKYGDEIEKKIKDLNLENEISISGPIYDPAEKIILYDKFDFFILPSQDEADSVALKESLVFGLPLIITKSCKFHDVEKNNIGYWIDHDPVKIYDRLIALDLDLELRKKMSMNCKIYAKEFFDISKVGNFYRKNIEDIVFGVRYSNNWY